MGFSFLGQAQILGLFEIGKDLIIHIRKNLQAPIATLYPYLVAHSQLKIQ